jgi:hypothetical protein
MYFSQIWELRIYILLIFFLLGFAVEFGNMLWSYVV